MSRPALVLLESNRAKVELVRQVASEAADIDLVLVEDFEEGVAVITEMEPLVVVVNDDSPSGSGAEMAMRLSLEPRTSGIPVIALASTATRLRQFSKLGVDAVLSEPFDRDSLKDFIVARAREREAA